MEKFHVLNNVNNSKLTTDVEKATALILQAITDYLQNCKTFLTVLEIFCYY